MEGISMHNRCMYLFKYCKTKFLVLWCLYNFKYLNICDDLRDLFKNVVELNKKKAF